MATKPGTVIRVTPEEVDVQWGDGVSDVYTLRGVANPPHVEVGDIGTLEYYAGPGIGFWFFTRENVNG